MEDIFVVGYGGRDAGIDAILKEIDYSERISTSSIEYKTIKSVAARWMRNNSEKVLSHYPRVYVVIGKDIDKQLESNEDRFFKMLSGDVLVDVLYKTDMSLLELIRQEMKKLTNQRTMDYEVMLIESDINLLNRTFKRDLKEYNKLKDTPYLFGAAQHAIGRLIGKIQKFQETKNYEAPPSIIRRNVIKRLDGIDAFRKKIDQKFPGSAEKET